MTKLTAAGIASRAGAALGRCAACSHRAFRAGLGVDARLCPGCARLRIEVLLAAARHSALHIAPVLYAAADLGVAPFDTAAHAPLALDFYWSPLKVFEYMASGLPVISTRGIGDLDSVIDREGVGVLLDGFTVESYAHAFRRADALRKQPGFSDACREVAHRFYDLHSIGSARYMRLYRAVSGSPLAIAIEEECAPAP